jgi:hypothetical protein
VIKKNFTNLAHNFGQKQCIISGTFRKKIYGNLILVTSLDFSDRYDPWLFYGMGHRSK